MEFAMVMAVRPISSGAEHKSGFQASLAQTAQAAFAGRAKVEGDLYIRITWFHRERTTQDVDNIAKRIIDSLEGAVFDNDNQIVKCLTQRIHTGQSYEISDRTILPHVYEQLSLLLRENEAHITYIEIGKMAAQRAVFGPIDGGAL